MNPAEERQQAEAALAAVGAQQERTRRAARMPWWVYAATFVLIAGGTALNDFLNLTGAKVLAGVVVALFIVVIVSRFATQSTGPLSWARGVQPRQAFVPWVFLAVVVVGGAGAWLSARYGLSFAHTVGGAIGLPGYPYTMMGVLFGLVLTAVFALGHLLTGVALARNGR